MLTAMWMEVALIGGLLFSWLALGVALFSLRQSRRRFKTLEKLYRRIGRELQVMNSGTIGMGQRLLAVEQRLNSTASQLDKTVSKQEQLEIRDVDQLSYLNAVRLLNAGVKADEVASSCGLSRAEASLMELMHGHAGG